MKYILLIGDGMGDVPVAALGGRTPLEAAPTPTLDRLARAGELLMVQTVPEGLPPGSDVANLALLGYQPSEVYTGRAPLEAASMGIAQADTDIDFRCNLINIQRQGERMLMVAYSAGHITTAEARELILALQAACGNTALTLHPGVGYRHLLALHNTPLPRDFTTTPPHDHCGRDVSAFFAEYAKVPALAALYARGPEILAAQPVNQKRQAAGKRPANFFWLWGEGKRPRMDTFAERCGLRGGMVSAVDLLKGIGKLSGLQVVDVPGATGYLDTNYAGKAAAALEILEEADFVAVHVEAPDECGHQGLAAEKMQAVADYDAKIVRPIVEGMERRGEPFRLVATMDHYTPLHLRTHVSWPVPMLLYDSRSRATDGPAYTEANAARAVEQSGRRFASGADFFRYFVEQRR